MNPGSSTVIITALILCSLVPQKIALKYLLTIAFIQPFILPITTLRHHPKLFQTGNTFETYPATVHKCPTIPASAILSMIPPTNWLSRSAHSRSSFLGVAWCNIYMKELPGSPFPLHPIVYVMQSMQSTQDIFSSRRSGRSTTKSQLDRVKQEK